MTFVKQHNRRAEQREATRAVIGPSPTGGKQEPPEPEESKTTIPSDGEEQEPRETGLTVLSFESAQRKPRLARGAKPKPESGEDAEDEAA